jgi:hypothetical protein
MTDTVQDLVQSPIETTSSPDSATSGKRTSQTAFVNAEFVPRKQSSSVAKKGDPITPLGHNAGNYYLIPPSGQLRKFPPMLLKSVART